MGQGRPTRLPQTTTFALGFSRICLPTKQSRCVPAGSLQSSRRRTIRPVSSNLKVASTRRTRGCTFKGVTRLRSPTCLRRHDCKVIRLVCLRRKARRKASSHSMFSFWGTTRSALHTPPTMSAQRSLLSTPVPCEMSTFQRWTSPRA